MSRAERFDDLVLESVERLELRWSKQLRGVEFAVEEVPPARVMGEQVGQDRSPDVPLGRYLPRTGGLPARIVVYRWPLEARARGRVRELGALVHDVLVEQVAEMLVLPPEEIDGGYRGGDAERGS